MILDVAPPSVFEGGIDTSQILSIAGIISLIAVVTIVIIVLINKKRKNGR